MDTASRARQLLSEIHDQSTQLGDLRKMAATIKKDHTLAEMLWASERFLPRQLAILIMDKKQLNLTKISFLTKDMYAHPDAEKLALMDWFMAHQLMKDRQTIALIDSWHHNPEALFRRTFWYYQSRLRWVGQQPPDNTKQLLDWIEESIEEEMPEVQWAMNFAAAQIGIFDEKYRKRCIAIGENTGLYKNEVVAKNCTPNYLPLFISSQLAKQKR